ncbi:MAG TPA: urate hydroxylase PuuD [Acidimicrobiales bacterium]|nr:urate hydroxylase PuuD [Acidimicrobiales bacterium]
MVLATGLGRALGIAGSRWVHLLAGIAWIGLLYYFNFVQTPSFAQFDAGARTEAQRKLLPRALWWFRMAAALTFVTGILILGFQDQFKGDYFKSWAGLSISAGILIATVMFLNVWLVIWPNQKIVIANADRVAGGQDPDPAAAPAARKSALASRTNTLFSIPVMWFMIGTSHWVVIAGRFAFTPGAGRRVVWYIVLLVLTAALEVNALGLVGGYGPSPTRKFLDDHRQTIIAGFVLWGIYFILQLVLSIR